MVDHGSHSAAPFLFLRMFEIIGGAYGVKEVTQIAPRPHRSLTWALLLPYQVSGHACAIAVHLTF